MKQMELEGGVNDKYRARLARRNWYANVQAPYFEHSVDLINAKIKSHYVRYFDLTSINIHLIENAPALLQSEQIKGDMVDPLLAQVQACIRNARTEFDGQIQKYGRMADAHGVTVAAKYFQEPLRVTVRIVSPICIEYLEAIQQGDQFLLILENLRLRGILKRAESDRLTANIDHLLKSIQRTAFAIVQRLRRHPVGDKAAKTQGAIPAHGAEVSIALDTLARATDQAVHINNIVATSLEEIPPSPSAAKEVSSHAIPTS